MSANQINISHLAPEVSTHRTHDACLMKNLASEGDFTTSELWSINWFGMSKGVFFIKK